MKVAEFLQARQANWRELEDLCRELSGFRRARPERVLRFASLYRSVCADLALADAHQLPPSTVRYLNQLVAQAHNQLYRSRRFDYRRWLWLLFSFAPAKILRSRAVWLAHAIFWSFFLLAAGLSWADPEFAERLLGREQLQALQEMYAEPTETMDAGARSGMLGFYVMNNAGIGLQVFALGLLFGVGGLFKTLANALILGASFGYMATTPQAENFFHFVTAHGPFELTAIVLAAGAGMQIGFALIDTRGLPRIVSLQRAARETTPIICTSVLLFCLAALVESFVSPSTLPYPAKAAVGALSAALLLLYFFVLGWTPLPDDAT